MRRVSRLAATESDQPTSRLRLFLLLPCCVLCAVCCVPVCVRRSLVLFGRSVALFRIGRAIERSIDRTFTSNSRHDEPLATCVNPDSADCHPSKHSSS